MGRPAGWMKELTGRAPMKSPGAPSLRREVERAFWRQIATGLTSEDAAIAVGVSQAAGGRWFRERGGMPTFMVAPLTGRYLSFREREEIAVLKAQGPESGRSPGNWVVLPRRSLGSFAGTRRPGVASLSTGHRLRSGRRNCLRGAPNQRNWWRTSDCATTCNSGLRAGSAARTGHR
jgi:hypothetical protein